MIEILFERLWLAKRKKIIRLIHRKINVIENGIIGLISGLILPIFLTN